jgi:gliding motility-associated-like protein
LAFAIGGAGNPAVTIIDSTDATCAQANGLAVASGIGGTGPLSYSWNTVPPQTGDTAQGLAPGTYTVTVTDTAGCSSTASVAIDSLSAPSLDSLSVQNEACGQGNGQASVSVTGGFAPYSYQWNTMPQQSGDTAQGLSAGLYTAIVTDSLGCQDSVQLKVDTIPAPGLALAGLADDTCAAAKGSAIVAVSGGTAPYSYTWNTSPPQSGPQASGLSAGTYTVTLVDSFGCTDTTSATINALPGPTLDSLGSQAATCGQANGRAVVGAAGGTTPYSYNWLTTPPQMGDTAAGLGGGSYEAVVTDANGCQDTQSVTVAATPAPNLTPDTAVAEACGQQDGRAIVSASGGTPPYTIAWNTTPSQTGDTASGLAAGTYTATLVDAASCTTTASITIDTVGGPAAALAGRRPATCDSANGRARATASGGTAPYAYTWLPEGTSGTTLAGLAGGDYRLVATDARGCRDTLPFSIPATPALAIDSVVTRPAFCEQGNGSAAVVLSGGTAPFQYTGKAFGNDSVASNLTPATYSVTVIDSAGCRDSASFTIGNEPGPALAVADTANPSCRGNDGQLRVEATGGHAPYTYSWANAPQRTGPAATGLSAGSYTITVTDSAGCEATRQLTLTKNCVPQIQIPSVFTPNGDGINDVWRLRGEGIAEFKLVVYNQWGQQVHSSTNPSRAWDGRIGGERAPAGVYNYVIRYRLQGAEQTHRRAGTMTLLR